MKWAGDGASPKEREDYIGMKGVRATAGPPLATIRQPCAHDDAGSLFAVKCLPHAISLECAPIGSADYRRLAIALPPPRWFSCTVRLLSWLLLGCAYTLAPSPELLDASMMRTLQSHLGSTRYRSLGTTERRAWQHAVRRVCSTSIRRFGGLRSARSTMAMWRQRGCYCELVVI